MNRGEVSDSIPIDLIIEILSRLPAKSIARFRCVSKLWESMFLRPYFTEMFLTRSLARPRLLFIVEETNDWCLFTSPQPQNLNEKSGSWSSLVLTANFHMKFYGGTRPGYCNIVSGLIYFKSTMGTVICNPTTGKYASLPLLGDISLLGYDPIEKQYKVLSYVHNKAPDQILTVGTGNQSWRKIHCPLNHDPDLEGICINGVLYYLAGKVDNLPALIVCFDVRSETFKFIHRDFFSDRHDTKLINYKGKLGVITLEYRSRNRVLSMYVIKDVDNPESSEWSEYSSFVDNYDFTIVGATATCEIILSTSHASKPFYVFFLNIERNTRQRVEIQGFRANSGKVQVFVDHVEDLNFITLKTTDGATSITRSSKDHLQIQDLRSKLKSFNPFDSRRRFLHDERYLI